MLNSNQLQNHPKFITVHGWWAGSAPHNPRTMDLGLGDVGYGFLTIFFCPFVEALPMLSV